jgi:hypothetical protein
MEFEEVFTSPFTAQTTCYSCGGKRIVGCSNSVRSFALQFATENHILGVRMSENATGNGDDDVKMSCRFLPRDSAQLTCVGYANWEEEEEEEHIDRTTNSSEAFDDSISSFTTVRYIEAMTLIDHELIEDHESSSSVVNLHRPSPVVIEKDDSTLATTTNVDGRPQSKRTSASTMTTTGTSSATNNPPLSSGSYHRKSQSELSRGSHTTISDSYHTNNSNSNIETEADRSKNNQALLTQKSKARLVLRQDQYAIHRSLTVLSGEVEEKCDQDQDSNDDQVYQRQLHRSSFTLLDFRPLCPCVARWGGQRTSSHIQVNKKKDKHEDVGFVGIWLGSADDATLRLYVPSPNDPRSLVSVALPEEHFSVDSPVMALDFCSVRWPDHGARGSCGSISAASPTTTTTHTLAIGCQDGTIQLITWGDPTKGDVNTATSNENKHCLFGDITSQKVIVDGPLVCLKIDYNQFTSLRVTVGSLCGYVCQLTYDYSNRGNLSDFFWEGPHIIVQDLFNSSINTEESVLTVDVWDNYVVVGTQLGRCLLYATHDSENYFLVWQAVLPYPVHGIAIINRNDTKAGHPTTEVQKEGNCSSMLSLAVTTRRSFHIFRASPGGIPWRQKPKRERYSSELAMTRLNKILQEIRKENQASDSITRKCVLEIIEDLLEKVENNNDVANYTSTDQDNTADVISYTISNILNRVEEHIVSENKTPASSIDSYDTGLEEKLGTRSPIDPPHWEYSSSDEDASL